jgi:hypothetical protein
MVKRILTLLDFAELGISAGAPAYGSRRFRIFCIPTFGDADHHQGTPR